MALLHPSFGPYETLGAYQTHAVTMQPVPSKVRPSPSMKVKAAKERSAPAPSAKEPQHDLRFGNTINFKGEEIRVDDILTVQIEDHYLRIETSDRKILVRYKISAAVKKIDPEVGLQLNCFTWIAWNEIKAVYRTPTYGAKIVLKNGGEFAVSRSRMSGVLETCKRWEISIESR